ncbi:hypothetical protein PG994_015271 [Apiospora phragmitis]|uniref:Uncharacterized protein n=1 Tax=Apiospora phragmitis TaxID=2905665 RepID=A0ABR1SR21_9PEZI
MPPAASKELGNYTTRSKGATHDATKLAQDKAGTKRAGGESVVEAAVELDRTAREIALEAGVIRLCKTRRITWEWQRPTQLLQYETLVCSVSALDQAPTRVVHFEYNCGQRGW